MEAAEEGQGVRPDRTKKNTYMNEQRRKSRLYTLLYSCHSGHPSLESSIVRLLVLGHVVDEEAPLFSVVLGRPARLDPVSSRALSV